MHAVRPRRRYSACFQPLILILVTTAACTDLGSGEPTGPDASPFYYYDGERIPLVVDTDRLVVQAAGPDDLERASVVVEEILGQEARVEEVRTTLPNHYFLWLDEKASPLDLRETADRLRDTDGIDFVSLAYRTREGGDEFVPLNRIMVEFVSGTSEQEITEINRLFGTRTLEASNPDNALFFHILEFTSNLDREPIELVAELYEHRQVKWAEVDKISNRHLIQF